MCEKRTRKIKKGSQITRLREARRLQRLQWIASPTIPSVESNPVPRAPCPVPQAPCPVPQAPCPSPPRVDKVAQNRLILELALKTIALMHKNRLIQQKIIELQKETTEFVASVMNNPENKQRCEQYRLQGWTQAQIQAQVHAQCLPNIPIKVEPTNV